MSLRNSRTECAYDSRPSAGPFRLRFPIYHCFAQQEPEVSDPPLEDASVKATRTTRFLLRPETCHEKNTRQKTELVEEEGDGEKETKKRKQPPKSAHGPAKSLKIDQPGFSESKLSFLPEIREAHLVGGYIYMSDIYIYISI